MVKNVGFICVMEYNTGDFYYSALFLRLHRSDRIIIYRIRLIVIQIMGFQGKKIYQQIVKTEETSAGRKKFSYYQAI